MYIDTSIPILKQPKKIIQDIEHFWNKVSLGWLKIWGQHIHHGYYGSNDIQTSTPKHAQEILIEKICQYLTISPSTKILDVGCGMGGTSIYLAKKFNANVTGVTLSTVQRNLAIDAAKQESDRYLEPTVNFIIDDAHSLNHIQSESVDLVWSLESCEQFYDKKAFIDQAHRVLKPNGRLMIATWCADQPSYSGRLAKRYYTICKSFLLPYLPTIQEYSTLLNNKFILQHVLDWSDNVKQSWALGMEELKKYSVFQLLKMGGLTGLFFVKSLSEMYLAFISGQLRYGVFIAHKNKSV